MSTRHLRALAVVLVIVSAVSARVRSQVPASGTVAASAGRQQPQPVPPDEQAFRSALAIKDPDAKLLAFQKLLKDWPDSRAVKSGAADFNILQLTVAAVASAAREANRSAAAFSRIPDNRDGGSWLNMLVAMAFARTETMWPETERYARKALEYWDSGGASREPPRQSGVSLERAVPLAVLGQAVAKQGRDDEAERYLREAYAARADEPGVVSQVVPLLLDIARRRGRGDEQVEWLIALALHGQLTPEMRGELERAYRSQHDGSLDGLEALLDARYQAELPAAIPVEPFVRPASAGTRTVLAEMFTGTSCAPCVGMDLALEAAMRRYQTRDLAVLVYHVHSPAPDPLVSPSGEAHARSYGVRGAPHIAIDGVELDDEGGGKAAEAAAIFRSRLQPAIDRALQAPPAARVSLRVARSGGTIRATVAVGPLPKGSPAVRLQVALVEERVRYSGGNGVRFHPMVVRKLAGDGSGLAVTTAGPMQATVAFEISAVQRELAGYLDDFERNGNADFKPSPFKEKKSDLDASRLVVVAFVQEAASHKVLQAAMERVAARP